MTINLGDSTATVRSKINAVLTDAGLNPAGNVDTTAATTLLNEAAMLWGVDVEFVDRMPEAEFRTAFAQLEETGPPYGIAGNRSGLLVTQATVRQVASKIVHRNGDTAIHNPRLRFVNWLVDASGVIVPNPFNVTVKASIQIGSGNRLQANFDGIPSSVILGTDPHKDSDPFMGVTIPANTDFTVRTWADSGLGGTFQFGIVGKTGLDSYANGESVLDTTMSGDPSGGFFRTYSASLVWGDCEPTAESYVVFGDSLTYGGAAAAGELSTTGGDAYGSRGYLGRCLRSSGFNYVNFGRASVRASHWALSSNLNPLLNLVEPVLKRSKVVVALGRNDVDANRTSANIISDLGSINSTIASRSHLSILQATILPKSSSTDGWVTTTNQTPDTRAATTNMVNSTIVSESIAGQSGVINGSIASSTSENSNLWKVDGGSWTTDGTHQTENGAALTASGTVLP